MRAPWLVWGVALTVGVGAGAGLALLHRGHASTFDVRQAATSAPVATWAAGARPAPDFHLVDQHGKPFALSTLRGRPVIVTFIDPLCRDFCPLEARVLSDAVRRSSTGARPVIVSVSVDPWGDSPLNFRADAAHWRLGGEWRWGAGTRAELEQVWRAYEVGVQVTRKRIAGVAVREISHTAATYLVDRAGDERALLLYPFRTADVVRALRRLEAR